MPQVNKDIHFGSVFFSFCKITDNFYNHGFVRASRKLVIPLPLSQHHDFLEDKNHFPIFKYSRQEVLVEWVD